MFHKGVSLQSRMLSIKDQAHGMARNFMGKMNVAYHTGRHIAGHIDRAYNLAKRLHDNHAKAIQNASPELARVTKKAMTGYEATRAAVTGASQAGERISNILAS